MFNKYVYNEICESTIRIRDIIDEQYSQNSSGSINGYLLILENKEHRFITRKEIKQACTIIGDNPPSRYQGSIVCDITEEVTRTLAVMLISIEVTSNINLLFRDNVEEYTFKKFDILSDLFPEYRYYENKFWKYKKTGHSIPIFKMDIEW